MATSYYRTAITERLAKQGYVGKYDARHIEGWMRSEHGTLDNLMAFGRFNAEVELARQCVDASTLKDSESLALSFGL